jgi:phage tail-like protein
MPLHLAPQQVANTEDWIKADGPNVPTLDLLIQTPSLHLMPGRPGQLSVQIESHTKHPQVAWHIAITGNFPQEWLPESPKTPSNTQVIVVPEQNPTEQQSQKAGSEPWKGLPSIEDFLDENGAPKDVIGCGDRREKTFTFSVPDDYFERQAALGLHQPKLPLNYTAEISLYAALFEAQSHKIVLAGFRTIQLQVRPSSPYIAFLPAIYQASDVTSRFLAIIEQAFDPTVQTIDNLWAYLDPLTAPEALLPFLARWVAWPLDARWSIPEQRRLLRRAVELYRWRGTRYGLRLYLHLYTDLPLDDDTTPESQKHISVVENHQTGLVMGSVEFAQTPMLGGGRPFHFSVTLRSDRPQSLDESCLRTIIDQVKPAFCTYDLAVVALSEAQEEG